MKSMRARTNTTRRHCLIALAWLLLLLGVAPLAAKVDVKNVNAVVKTENDPSDPDKKKVTVTVTYDLEGTLDGKGAVVSLDARLRSPANNHNFRPTNSELEGDFGGVLGDGSKQIVWDATKTLERNNAEGKYDCTIDISVEGQSEAPARAYIDINEYDPGAGWKYFTTGRITFSNLTPTTKAAICAVSDNWQNTPDADAQFYKGDFDWDPIYRGNRQNSVWSGPINGGHCSGFLAAKNLGTVDEKVWINFAGSFHDVGTLPNGNQEAVDYVFQVRYYRVRSGQTLTEFVKMGNAGNPGDTDGFAETTALNKYSVTIDVGKEDIEASNEFELEVLKKVYKWYEGGALVMEARAKGEGHFVEEDGIYKLTDGNEVVINKKLTISGLLFQIDTTYVNGAVAKPVLTFTGSMTADGLPAASNLTFSPWTMGKELTLFPGSDWRADAGNLVLSAFGGMQFFPTKFSFDGGTEATAIKMDGRFLIHSAAIGCTSPLNPEPGTLDTYKSLFGSPVGIDVEGAEIIAGELTFSKITITKFGVKAVPGLCLDEFVYSYDRDKDSLGVSAKLKFPMPVDQAIGGVGGGFSFYKGGFNGLMVEAEVTVPLEPPPLVLKGFKGGFDNLVTGPVKIKAEATFSHLGPDDLAAKGLAYIGPFGKLLKVFPTIFEVTGGVEIIWPDSWALKGAIKLFGSEGLGIWLAEGEVTAGVEPLKGLLFAKEGSLKFASVAGSKPFMDGTFSGSICLDAANAGVSFDTKGTLYVPNLVNNIPILGKLAASFGLPLELAAAELQVRNTKASVKVPSRGKNAERVIEVDLTLFPFPEAFSCPACDPISLFGTEEVKGPSPLAGDTTFHSANVTTELGEVIFQISGAPSVSTTVLVDPSGTVYSATKADSSIVFSRVADSVHLWTVVDPAPGVWKLGVIDQKSTDIIDAFGIRRAREPFVFEVDENDRTVTVTWDGSAASDSSEVDFFLDQDKEGYNGLPIGTVLESAGTFTYRLTDSLPECSYYLHTLRYDQGDYSKSYHDELLLNPKSGLQAPSDLSMSVDGDNNVTLTWTRPNDTNVASYLVRLSYPDGPDTLIAMVPSYLNVHQFRTDGTEGLMVSVQAVDTTGNTGCWSEMIGVPISGVDQDEVVAGESADLVISMAPNPASTRLTVVLNVEEPGPLTATLYDVNGREVRTLLAGEFHRGRAEATVNVADVPSGSYVLAVTTAGRTEVRQVVIQR